MPEIRIDMDEIQDPQTITQVNIRKFLEHGVDIHRNEVDELIDDYDTHQRVLKVRGSKKFFFLKR